MIRRLKPRSVLLRQVGLTLAVGAALAVSAPARVPAAPLPAGAADSALAVFDGGTVMPSEYAVLWTKAVMAQRPEGKEDEAQRTFLTRIVDRKLLAKAIADRPFTPSSAEQWHLDRTRDQLVKNLLFHRTIGQLPEPTPEELDRFVRRQNEIAIARFIVFGDWDRARSWRNRLLTGTPMSAFEAAVRREGPALAAVDSFRMVAAEQIPDTLAQVIWSLRPGQVSDVIGFGGRATLAHLLRYEPRPARISGDGDMTAAYKRRQYDFLRERERLRLAESVGRRFEEDAMSILLAAHLRVPPRRDVDSVSGLPVMRPNLPLPEVAVADTGRVLARTRYGDTTIAAYMHFWSRIDPLARPEVAERSTLEGTVDRVALDGEILREALAQGLERDSSVAATIARQRESYALDAFFREEIEQKVVVPEKEIRALWARNPAHYNETASLEARLLAVDRRSLADSILARLQNGASFDEMVRLHSTDQSTANNGGRTGTMYRGSQRNAGLENSMFATEVGSVGGPEFTPEGWVLWKIDGKKPAITRDFEAAREMVERDARIIAGERLLEKKLAELRKKARVKFFPERIAGALREAG